MPEIPYLAEASIVSVAEYASRLTEINTALQGDGVWEEIVEWRISTRTTRRIEPESDSGRRWFKVSVASGGEEMICRTPTLERAVEFMGVFDRLIMDMLWTLGWASWAAKGRLESLANETTLAG